LAAAGTQRTAAAAAKAEATVREAGLRAVSAIGSCEQGRSITSAAAAAV
jgi:hypothetical protein